MVQVKDLRRAYISLSGDASILAIGARKYVKAYNFSNRNEWVQRGRLLERVWGRDHPSHTISLSQDGNTLTASDFPSRQVRASPVGRKK